MSFFSVETTAVVLFGLPVSWLELVSSVLGVLGVVLMARRNVWTWPVGLAAVSLGAMLCWQIQLYVDMFEQFFYLVTNFWGWWLWSRGHVDPEGVPAVRRLTSRQAVAWTLVVVGLTVAMATVAQQLHLWSPTLFPAPASYPWVDATTTAASFVGQVFMAQGYLVCWPMWVVIDVVGVVLYWEKGITLYAVQYAIFVVLAADGWRRWLAAEARQAATAQAGPASTQPHAR